MPFCALYVPERRVVTIEEDHEEPAGRWEKSGLVCHLPECGKPLIVSRGEIRAHHFRHQGGLCGCPYADPESWEESPEHRWGKRFVAKTRLEEIVRHGFQAQARFEVAFPDIRRVADVVVEWPTGHTEVHEVQVSCIRPDEVRARTLDYRSAGADPCWWFHDEARSTLFDAETEAARLGALGGTFRVHLDRTGG